MKETLFKGYYATEEGKIISMKSGKQHEKKVTFDDWGYPRIQIWDKNKPMFKRIHQLVAEAYMGKTPEGMQIDHVDGNKLNSRPDNLEFVTPSENLKRAYKLGLRERNIKLSDDTWVELLNRINEGESIREIAKEYGIHESSIHAVRRGHKRKWMTEEKVISRTAKQAKRTAEEVAEMIRASLNGMEHKELTEHFGIPYKSWMEILGKRRRLDAWELVEGSQAIESTPKSGSE